MTNAAPPSPLIGGPARVESLRIRNYRALQDVEIKDITPLTVLLGPNGSGKSTIFDVFNFLSVDLVPQYGCGLIGCAP